jgi:hypothetical protein
MGSHSEIPHCHRRIGYAGIPEKALRAKRCWLGLVN